jgi:hypothetical protein
MNGHSPEFSSVQGRYEEEAKLYEEKLLEMRNMGVSGVMPFRISLLSFGQNPIENGRIITLSDGSKIYAQPDAVLQKLRHSLQPVTTFFWPRTSYGEINATLKKELVVSNDSETENTFTVKWKWQNKEYSEKISLAPGAQKRIDINLSLPSENSNLTASIFQDTALISVDTLFIKSFAKPILNQTKQIQVYRDVELAKKLNEQGFKAFASNDIPTVKNNTIWLFPENANNRELTAIKTQILAFMQDGGAVLSLKQDQTPSWFPVKFLFASANQSNLHNYARMGWEGLNKDLFFSIEVPIYNLSHPIFKGLNTTTLQGWNSFDGRVADDVFARPSSNNKYEQGNWTTLSGGTRREQISLAEIFFGKGILLACQLNIMSNLENPQAKAVFVNMINYLSGKKSETLNNKIQIAGIKSTADLGKLISVEETVFQGAKPENGDWLFAFDGTSLETISAWKANGGKILVLSPIVAAQFEGIKISEQQESGLLATKIAEHDILDGIASANFMDTDNSLFHEYFTALPQEAKILLQGFKARFTFWRVAFAHPVMVSLPFKNDTILVSTIQLDQKPIALQQEFLAQLLTNAGVAVPFLKEQKQTEIQIKKTVPIKIDGELEEWLEDMEDRLVTPYIHAQPIYLSSENRVSGPQISDLNLSAINYMMWNKDALHIAGVVFMEQKFFGGENYPGNKNYQQQIKLNDDVITIQVLDEKVSVSINGNSSELIEIKLGQINSKEMTDATQLQFNYIHASGKINTMENLTGETFEMRIPWSMLKTKASDTVGKAMFSLENKTAKIQEPLKADLVNKNDWRSIIIKK